MRRSHVVVLIAVVCFISGAGFAQDDLAKLKDFRIDGLMRFQDSAGAEATRDKLVRAIWPDGLPKTRPTVTPVAADAPEIAAIDAGLYDKAFRHEIDVSGFDWKAFIFVLTPKAPAEGAPRLAIVQGGHMPEGPKNYLVAGLSDSANQLLRDGYVVALVQMPLTGWNHDADGAIDGHAFSAKGRTTRGHDDLFRAVEPTLKAGAMRFFMEPIVQSLNEMLATYPKPRQILMIGLSGGGWTTHLYAAIDTRIDVSIPVAGSLPLYARPFSPHSAGDAEQEYGLIFGERDSDGDGVLDQATGIASWLEVYALGGIAPEPGRKRRQIQVLNLYDSCCFSGKVHETYGEPLARHTAKINGGDFSIFVDDTHRDHLISRHVIDEVLRKAEAR